MNIVFFGERTAGAYVELAFFFGTATLVLAAYGSIIKNPASTRSGSCCPPPTSC